MGAATKKALLLLSIAIILYEVTYLYYLKPNMSGFTSLNAALSNYIVNEGKVLIRPFPRSNLFATGNTRSERLVLVIVPAMLSLVTGIPILTFLYIPLAHMILLIALYLYSKNVLKIDTSLALLASAITLLEPHVLTTIHNLNTQGFGYTFLLLFISILYKHLTTSASRREALLLMLLFLGTIWSYYTAELVAITLITLLIVVYSLFRQLGIKIKAEPYRDVAKKNSLRCLYVVLLILLFLLEPLHRMVIKNILVGGSIKAAIGNIIKTLSFQKGSEYFVSATYITQYESSIFVVNYWIKQIRRLTYFLVLLPPIMFLMFQMVKTVKTRETEEEHILMLVLVLGGILSGFAYTIFPKYGFITLTPMYILFPAISFSIICAFFKQIKLKSGYHLYVASVCLVYLLLSLLVGMRMMLLCAPLLGELYTLPITHFVENSKDILILSDVGGGGEITYNFIENDYSPSDFYIFVFDDRFLPAYRGKIAEALKGYNVHGCSNAILVLNTRAPIVAGSMWVSFNTKELLTVIDAQMNKVLQGTIYAIYFKEI